MRRPIISERAIQTAVIQHWRALGVPGSLVAAIPNAGALGQPGLTAGLSDLLVLGGIVRVAFIELKTARGRTSDAQLAFQERCRALAIPCIVTHGRDEPITLLETWGVIRPRAGAAA
ncbi:hypothetical protein A3862_27325 [Methylobacterium sp. XJLW]|jgi:hypothetical protein|uniref:hypothetical protein n=1 Tax=Methylobacterium sp. XJLW TaxID=739141 RepID=UPI000DAB0218|nr:hypothetical protein [Methylobacterium sp. XJLW]AWV18793.1 hypothetical protein A3862_27325 [Methylobacterium sp. XJLW]